MSVADAAGCWSTASSPRTRPGRSRTWVKAHDCAPEYVYITHPHADHFLGLPEILERFPDAKPVALAESIPAMKRGSTPDSRASWMRALDAVAALGATTVVAGHRHPQAVDDDAHRQLDECRHYLADFEAALQRSSSPAELIDRMMAAHPALANPYTLWVAAHGLLGNQT